MYLVDTSVWIQVFRAKRALQIESVVPFEQIVTCLPIVQEVLQGFRDESAFRTAKDAMLNFPIVESPLRSIVYLQAVDLYRQARKNGLTIRSSVDCLLAACAIRNDLNIVHEDRDFPALAKVSQLKQEQL
jgi:predicted nucleic acid-binding protein